MKTFNLVAEVTISVMTIVEAETLEEAIEVAEQRSIEAAQWHSGNQKKEVWVSDEYDGEPQNIHEE